MVKIQNQNGEDWKDREKLKATYERCGSQHKVAEELGTTRDIIRYWINKFDIERYSEGVHHAYKQPYENSIWERGYGEVRVQTEDGLKTVRVHRLVAVAEFGIEAVKDMDVHHKNQCPHDNRRENLEVISRENHAKIHIGNKKDPQQG